MSTVTATSARTNLYRLIDQVNEESTPITITGRRNSAVLLSADDWNAIQETLYLQSIPGMADSLHQAHNDGIAKGSRELPW